MYVYTFILMCVCICHVDLRWGDQVLKAERGREKRKRALCYEHPLIVSHRYIRTLPRGIEEQHHMAMFVHQQSLLPLLKSFISLSHSHSPHTKCASFDCVYMHTFVQHVATHIHPYINTKPHVLITSLNVIPSSTRSTSFKKERTNLYIGGSGKSVDETYTASRTYVHTYPIIPPFTATLPMS